MFSLVSVCPQTGGYAWSHVPSGGCACLVSGPFQGVGMSRRVGILAEGIPGSQVY